MAYLDLADTAFAASAPFGFAPSRAANDIATEFSQREVGDHWTGARRWPLLVARGIGIRGVPALDLRRRAQASAFQSAARGPAPHRGAELAPWLQHRLQRSRFLPRRWIFPDHYDALLVHIGRERAASAQENAPGTRKSNMIQNLDRADAEEATLDQPGSSSLRRRAWHGLRFRCSPS